MTVLVLVCTEECRKTYCESGGHDWTGLSDELDTDRVGKTHAVMAILSRAGFARRYIESVGLFGLDAGVKSLTVHQGERRTDVR